MWVKESQVITGREVACAREEDGRQVELLVDFMAIERRQVTVLSGEAGSGHALCLRILGLLERPDSGEIDFAGQATTALSDEALASLRTRSCGYVFSSPFLLPGLTVLENIAMPAFKVCNLDPAQARERTDDLLTFTGLQDVATCKDISLARQFRTSLARALAAQPSAIFVEATGALSASNDPEFPQLLAAAAERYDVAVIVAAAPANFDIPGERRLHFAFGRLQLTVPS